MLATSCSVTAGRREADGSVQEQAYFGSYEQSGCIGFLDLLPDGTYSTLILNGITSDGCGTFEGAGISEGSWRVEDGMIFFDPAHEPDDLVVKFADVSGTLTEVGLALNYEGRDFMLPRFIEPDGERSNTPMQTDGASRRR